MDTRWNILAGAWVIDEMEKRSDFKEFVYRHLETFLVRPDDRALFDLPPLPGTELKTEPLANAKTGAVGKKS